MTTAIVRIVPVLFLFLSFSAPLFFGGRLACLNDWLTDTIISLSLLGVRVFCRPSIPQDTRAMTAILSVIRVNIVSDNLQSAELIQ